MMPLHLFVCLLLNLNMGGLKCDFGLQGGKGMCEKFLKMLSGNLRRSILRLKIMNLCGLKWYQSVGGHEFKEVFDCFASLLKLNIVNINVIMYILLVGST